MNAFATAAKAAAPEELEKTSTTGLISRFLTGGSGSSGDYHAVENNLYHKKKVIARLTPNGTVLLPESNLSDVQVNDVLIGSIFASGRGLRRVKNFDRMSNPTDRLNDLEEGRVEDFSNISSLFGFTYSDDEVRALDIAKKFRERARAFFEKIEKDEADRVRTAEERALAERLAAAALGWDRGEGKAQNSKVQGEGGKGQRLRLAKKGLVRRGVEHKQLETSTGHKTTLTQAKRAWDYASQQWSRYPNHGSQHLNECYLAGGRYCRVYGDRVEFGCQTAYKPEIERFAKLMGWPSK